MKTSYFWKAIFEPEPNTKYVSISLQQPRFSNRFPEYPSLFPDWKIIKYAHDRNYDEESFQYYRREYYAMLDKLNPEKIYKDLENCTILCYESPKDLISKKKFCHRRMVAGWIEETLGIVISEELRKKDSDAGTKVPAIYRK